jgi:hypothetical protein
MMIGLPTQEAMGLAGSKAPIFLFDALGFCCLAWF